MSKVRRVVVRDRSMEPTLVDGDRLVALRRPPRRGELVVVGDPARPGGHLVKRVLALAGQQVSITQGEVVVDGEVDDPWGELVHTPGEGSWAVAAGHGFVLSDNRSVTLADSRTLGPVPLEGALVALARYRPWSRRGLLVPLRRWPVLAR